ncbi:hypothetical protein CY35_09G012900 [Sphagnum magellanicum]|nr:hypothetical protein CY35_09G012900 [Sphagnum magellanicum]
MHVNWGLPCILNFMQRVMLLTAVMTERCPDLKSFTSLSSTCKTEGDRQLLHSYLTVISTGGHHGILPSLMQKTIGSITDSTMGYSIIPFVEALLVSSSTGYAVLREGGLIPTLLPLLKDMDPEHTCLVSAAMHILEDFMDYRNQLVHCFEILVD